MTRPARSPRALVAACAAAAVSAALLWGASVPVWYRVTVPGRTPVEFTGAQVGASPAGIALLALAGVAALVATGGPVRRAVGALLAVAGAAVAAIAVRALLTDPFATDGALPRPPSGVSADALRYQPVETTPAPLLAVAGGAVLLAAGLFVVLREPRLPRLGARYAAPGRRPAEVDPDRAAWQDLDAGRDPTAGRPRDTGDDPGDGTRTGPG